MTVHFCVHDDGVSVGVVVVEGIKAGQTLNGWIMDQDRMIELPAKSELDDRCQNDFLRGCENVYHRIPNALLTESGDIE